MKSANAVCCMRLTADSDSIVLYTVRLGFVYARKRLASLAQGSATARDAALSLGLNEQTVRTPWYRHTVQVYIDGVRVRTLLYSILTDTVHCTVYSKVLPVVLYCMYASTP